MLESGSEGVSSGSRDEVVFCDVEIGEWLKGRDGETDESCGLTEADADRAIAILNGAQGTQI